MNSADISALLLILVFTVSASLSNSDSVRSWLYWHNTANGTCNFQYQPANYPTVLKMGLMVWGCVSIVRMSSATRIVAKRYNVGKRWWYHQIKQQRVPIGWPSTVTMSLSAVVLPQFSMQCYCLHPSFMFAGRVFPTYLYFATCIIITGSTIMISTLKKHKQLNVATGSIIVDNK